jgi:formylmethanofuran dehydrogenase subunit E
MTTERPSDPAFDAVVAFHGHLCLDIAMGYRVAKAAMRELSCERPRDEELVAIVENDSCSVDAVQAVTGCTFGKGNLVYHPLRQGGVHLHRPQDRPSRSGLLPLLGGV